MAVSVLNQQVSDTQLSNYAKLIYDQTGIQISPKKKTLLSNRLLRRMRATDIVCFDDYFKHLQKLPTNDPEWDYFLQEITTHETYLFRDPTQWLWFADAYLHHIQQQVKDKKKDKSLRIWSAACSTGDEACTIACCLADGLVDRSQWKIEIVCTDIGVGALEQAKKATFGKRAMRLVSEKHCKRFFTPTEDEKWIAKPALTKWISVKQHNLMDPLKSAPFDLVILKNVLIYFDAESKKKVIENIDRVLQPEGLLMTGPAEGVSGLMQNYERLQPWLHRKK